jgi:hypothetical protein
LFDGPEDDPQREQIGRGERGYEVLSAIRRPISLPNGGTMTMRQRDKLVALWYGLTGEAYLLKQRIGGRVVSLAPVSPLWVKSTPTTDSPVYKIQVNNATTPLEFYPKDVIPIVDPDPELPFGRGSGVGMALDDELDTDEASAAMGRAILHNHGVPSGLMVLDGASKEELKAAQVQWEEKFQGPGKAGRIEFARGRATFIPISSKAADAQILETRKFLRDTFFHVYGVSPEVFGVIDGGTRDSAWVAYMHLALGALVPWLETLVDCYQAHLVPDFGDPDDIVLGYSSPVPDDRDLQIRCVATAPSAFRAKDIRKVGGFAPDAELDEKQLVESGQAATPTQLPSTPNGLVEWTIADGTTGKAE